MNKQLIEDPEIMKKAEKEKNRLGKKLQLDQGKMHKSILENEKCTVTETIDYMKSSYYELPLAKRNELAEQYTNISSSLATFVGEKSINSSLARVGVWRENLKKAHGAGAADFDY